MSGICLMAGLLLAVLDDTVTLSWTHSIQKTVWEEDYRREGNVLRLTEARVRGTGAGMEPPQSAVLKQGVWHYVPALPTLPSVQLRHSPYTAAYRICSSDRCQLVTEWLPGLPEETVIGLAPCPPTD
jgi:hypothetical protein